MSMAALERMILASARIAANNPKLKLSQIAEWSTSEERVLRGLRADEVMIALTDPRCWVAIPRAADMRRPA